MPRPASSPSPMPPRSTSRRAGAATPSPCRPATARWPARRPSPSPSTDVAPSTPVDSNAAGQHRRRRRGQRLDRRRHRVVDRRQRPGRDLFADRRHLRRRLHHRCRDRRRHRRRCHQDRLRDRRRHAYTVTAQASDGTLSSSRPSPSASPTSRHRRPVGQQRRGQHRRRRRRQRLDRRHHRVLDRRQRPGRHLFADRRHLGGGFTINAATGVVTVADATKIDYETAPGHAYTVTAQASDGTLTSSQTFTIGVTDVAPSTPVDGDAAANTSPKARPTARPSASPRPRPTSTARRVTYSLIGDTSGGGFTINAATGVVTVANSSKIDFETVRRQLHRHRAGQRRHAGQFAEPSSSP